MEGKNTLDKLLFFANKRLAAILEYSFMIDVLIIAIIISTPLFEDKKHQAARITLLFYPVSISLIRWLAGTKNKRAVGYIYGTLLIVIIVSFRLAYNT